MSNLLEKASILLTPTAYDDGKMLSVKPEDGTGDFDFTRNSSATRVNSQGLIEDVQILSSNLVSNGDFSQEGSELVTNGDFSNGANNWSLGTGWSIGVGKVIGSSASGTLSQAGIASAGKQYKVTFSVTDYSSGTLYIDIGGSSAQTTTSNGLKTFYFTSTSTDSLRFYGGSFTGSIDNVSVKEVGQDWTLGASWSIGNNKATRLTSVDWGLDQTISSAVNGRTYRVTTEITDYTSGELRLALGSGGTVNVIGNALGVYVNEFVWDGSSGSIIRFQGTFVGSISNITILEITDDTNLPRIDYSPYSGAGTCGHWLFEPQSTNLLTYSEDLTQGSLNRLLLTSNTDTSPDGTNTADKLIPNNTNSSYHYFAFSTLTIATNNVYSVFLKKAEYEYALISFETSGLSGSSDKALINLNNGNIEQSDTETKVEDFGNGWYRCSIKATSARTSVVIYPLPSASLVSFTGDNTSGIFAWGLQLEQQPYPTSYIPTSGSTVTRLKDAAFGAGNSSLINSTEGVLYVEVAALAEQTLTRYITLSSGASSNRIIIYITDVGVIKFFVGVGGVTQAAKTVSGQTTTNFNKLAVSYKENDIKFYLNGVKVHTDTSASTFPANTLNVLNFAASNGTSSPFFGKTKCAAVFKEALTDAELTCLTTI